MLPDLYLSLVLPGGRRGGIVARDVPAAVFFAGWPGPDANPEHAELWRDRLLGRVAVSPILSAEVLMALGDARLDALAAYLHAVGWPGRLPTAPAEVAAAGHGCPAGPAIPLGMLTAAPHPVLARRLTDLASDYGLDPLKVWYGPISEFLWVLRLRQAAEGPVEAPRGLLALPEELRHIGLATEDEAP